MSDVSTKPTKADVRRWLRRAHGVFNIRTPPNVYDKQCDRSIELARDVLRVLDQKAYRWEGDDDRDPGPAQVVKIRKRLAAVATDVGRALLDEVRALREVSAERDHLRAEAGAMRDALATILKECIKEIDDEEYAATCPYWNPAVYAAKAALSGTATTAYAARVTALEAARDALAELVEVAGLRGDNDLPHPANDEKLWTARMQTAWDDAQAALDADPAYIRGLTTAVRSVKARVEAMNPKRRLT